MQQTTKYKLNLIETTDTFSPDPLNDNTQKVEAAIAAETAARQSADTALSSRVATLSSRVTALEAQKIYYGDFFGGTAEQTVNLGVTPLAVYVHTDYVNGFDSLVLSTECGGTGTNENKSLQIIPNGFHATTNIVPSHVLQHFFFIALV